MEHRELRSLATAPGARVADELVLPHHTGPVRIGLVETTATPLVRLRAKALGIPLTRTTRLFVQHLDGRAVAALFGDEWGDYRIDFLGRYVTPPPLWPPAWPYFRIGSADYHPKSDVVAQLWQRTIQWRDSPLRAVAVWHPDGGTRAGIEGYEQAFTAAQHRAAQQSRALLVETARTEPRPTGHPPEPNGYDRDRYLDVWRELRPQHSRRGLVRALAAACGVTEVTIRNWHHKYGWPIYEAVE